jgi:hypothetical protein
MTKEQKIIRAKVGLLELPKQLGNVSQGCKNDRLYLPIVFNFDKPETKDFTETVRLLAGLSKFVIADITNPKSSPLELQATIPVRSWSRSSPLSSRARSPSPCCGTCARSMPRSMRNRQPVSCTKMSRANRLAVTGSLEPFARDVN